MPNFKYKARDRFARLVTGVISASDKDAVAKRLAEMSYSPIEIGAVNEFLNILNVEKILSKFKRVGLQEVAVFTRQLYSLQKAGIPLLVSLEAIAQQSKNLYFKKVIEEMAFDIKGGASFSDAIKKHDNVFDGIYISMIKAAESGGLMSDILFRLTTLIEQDMNTRAQIQASTRYPMIAFFSLCIGFAIVITFVVPRFAGLYGQFKVALPLPTQILIGINLVIRKFWYLMILGFGTMAFLFRRFINSDKGRPLWDNLKLKVPVFGPLVTMLVMSRFARVTSILMKGGVSILEIMDLTANTSGNVIIARAIRTIRESINQGKGIAEPMKLTGLFPPAVTQMVAIGEQSGRVDDLLMGVADYYDTEAGYMIKNLTTYIEPILIFVLGIMVLILALGIFLPMWNLINVFKGG